MDFLDFLGTDAAGGASSGASPNGSPPIESDQSDDEAVHGSRPAYSPVDLKASLARMKHAVDDQAVATFRQQGYLVIDGVLSPNVCRALRETITDFYRSGVLVSNATAFVSKHLEGEKAHIAQLFSKPGIFETEVTKEMRESTPAAQLGPLAWLYDSVVPELEAHLAEMLPEYELFVAQGLGSIKVQYNEGRKACFPFHYDSPGGKRDSRRLTMLLYLNEEWKEGDGGELVLQPFLQRQVHVRPLFNRIAIFKSAELLHRVEPSHAVRQCLTIWLHGAQDEKTQENESTSTDGEASTTEQSDSSDFASVWSQRLAQPRWQRVLSKTVYQNEWAESFLAAHGRGTRTAGSEEEASTGTSTSAIGGGIPLVDSLRQDDHNLRRDLAQTGVLELLTKLAEEGRSQAPLKL